MTCGVERRDELLDAVAGLRVTAIIGVLIPIGRSYYGAGYGVRGTSVLPRGGILQMLDLRFIVCNTVSPYASFS
jgi:hypothetical protein